MPIPLIIAGIAAAAAIAAAAVGRAVAEGDYNRARDIYDEAVAEYGQDILPELDKLVAEQVPETEFAKIKEDSQLRSTQVRAMRELENVYNQEGMTEADEAAMRLARGQVSAQAGSDYQNINQMLARRGQIGSGAQAAAMYGQAGQDAALSLGQMANESAIAARQRALSALEASAGLAGNIRGQDYGIARDKAGAQDTINQFNARMRDAAARANMDAQQMQFQNELALRDRRNAARYRKAGSYEEGAERTMQTAGQVGQAFTSFGAGAIKGMG